MARKLTRQQTERMTFLTDRVEAVRGDMDALWFMIDSKHPADPQLYILVNLLDTVERTLRSILTHHGSPHHA